MPGKAATSAKADICRVIDALDLHVLIEEAQALKAQRAALDSCGGGEEEAAATARVERMFVELLDTMHEQCTFAQEQAVEAKITLSHRVAKYRRMLWYGMVWDGCLELLNEVGDVLFLVFKLPQ